MIIDGKQLAEDVYARLPQKTLKLGILVGRGNPVIDSFVRIKERAATRLGVMLVKEEIDVGTTEDVVLSKLASLAECSDGVIVQLPLPDGIDTERVLAAIPPEKDVDGIAPNTVMRPPVAAAVRAILAYAGIDVAGKRAVVVGSGRLVGSPCAQLLSEHGALVTILGRGDSLEALQSAEIVILGAGDPGIVKPEHLTKGVVLIDAGTSESGGRVSGDADPSCAQIASVFTPVPGGIGPIAVAMIFKNLSDLAGRVSE